MERMAGNCLREGAGLPMDEGLEQGIPEQEGKEDSGSFTISFRNKQEDLMTAIEVIDMKNKIGVRRNVELLALALVAYWSVEMIFQMPTFLGGWLMFAASVGVGIFALVAPKKENLKYTARFAQRAPESTVTADAEGFSFEDGTGRAPYRYSEGLKLYEYKNILALDGGKRRFAQIPLDQIREEDKNILIGLIREGRYEKVEAKEQGQGFFRKKPL